MYEGTESPDAQPASPGSEAASTADTVTPELSRKVRPHKKRSRSKTIAPRRLTKEELRQAALLPVTSDADRPQSRGDCAGGQRPCPWVSCKHHLYLDVNQETGSIKLNFPDLEVSDMKDTCSLDVADRGGITLEEVGEILNLTRERIRQVEVRGLVKLKAVSPDGDVGRDLPVTRCR
jgi:hypothetical protein